MPRKKPESLIKMTPLRLGLGEIDARQPERDPEPALPHWFRLTAKTPRRFTGNVVDGLHPHGHKLAANGQKCGTCLEYRIVPAGKSSVMTCTTGQPSGTAGDHSVRLSWPACEHWTSREG